MPLINSDSDEALKKNIKTEIAAGKDPKQAVAIALDIQRKAKAKKKKAKHAAADPQAKLAEIDFKSIKDALENANGAAAVFCEVPLEKIIGLSNSFKPSPYLNLANSFSVNCPFNAKIISFSCMVANIKLPPPVLVLP